MATPLLCRREGLLDGLHVAMCLGAFAAEQQHLLGGQRTTEPGQPDGAGPVSEPLYPGFFWFLIGSYLVPQ